MKKNIKYIGTIIAVALLFLLVILTQSKENKIIEENKQAYSLAPSVATSHTQTNTYTVKSINPVYVGAGTYWYQLGDKRWRADTQFGTLTVANKNNYPTPTVVKERHDLSNWQLYGDQAFRSDNGRVFNGAQLNEKFIASANDAKFRNASSFSGKGIQVESGTKVILNFESGYGYTPTKYNLISGSTTRHEAMYLTPFDVYWSGKVIETYEISTDPDTTINSGTTKQLFAFTRSKTGKDAWTGYKNVTSVPETKWTTDNSSVATVSSTGIVTGIKGGVATITATWKSGDYHIKASTKVTVKQMVVGTFLLNGKTNVCLSEDSLTIQALYYEGTSTGTNVLAETSLLTSNHNIASINNKIIHLHSVGKVTITGKYKDKTNTITITIIDCNTTPKPKDPTDPTPTEPEQPIIPDKPKIPPQVIIDEIPEVTVGEYFCFVSYATDEDGYITKYNWDKGSFITTDTTSSAICGYYDKVGKPSIKVTVTDNDGLTASATTTTNVKTATPSAYVYVSGDLRENRIVKVGVSDPYNDNEVLHQLAPITKQTLEVSVVNEGDEIKYQKAIPSTFTSHDIFEFIAKFSGEVKVKRTVENSLGQKDSFETTFFIAPDLAPIVDFRVSEINYRSYDEINGGPATAKISIDDSSYSIDGDKISKRILTVTFDSNNNGIFTDDIPNVIELEDEQKNVEFTTQKVGKYLIEMEVWEDIFTNTFFEYVDLTYNKESTDLRFADTSDKPVSEKITEVDNIAPSTSLNLSVRKKASVQVDVTNSPFSKEELQKQQAALNKELVQKNIVADLTFFDNTVNMDNVKYYVSDNKKIHFLQTSDNEMYVKYTTTQKHTFPAKIKKVSMGYEHAFVLLENNTYYGIGVEREGQMGGHGATVNSIGQPTLKEFSGFWRFKGLSIIDVSAGRDHSLFLTSTGSVYAIGANDFKQTGINSFDPYGEPPKVNLSKKIKAVQGGFYSSFLITENNTMMGVGYNDSGVLGLGNTTSLTTFRESTTINTIKEMFYTDSLTLILSSTNGSFYGVGLNNNDNLNVGSTTYVTRPTLIKDVPVGTIKIISNSSAAALVTNTGEVYVRGPVRNVGVNATGSGWTKITTIEGKAKDVDFAGYSSGSVIISTDKGFYHVVNNELQKIDVYGIFGLDEPKPYDIKKVANGYQYNFVLGLNQQGTEAYYKDVMKSLTDGHFIGVSKTQDTIINNVINWNENRGSFIKLGNDTKEIEIETMYKKTAEYIISVMNKKQVDVQFDIENSPYNETQIEAMTPLLNSYLMDYDLKAEVSFTEKKIENPIKMGSFFTVFHKGENSVYVSGYNEFGQLGDDTSQNKIIPTKLNLPFKVKQVETTLENTYFLTDEKDVYVTGRALGGALGLGYDLVTPVFKPIKMDLPYKVKEIITGRSHILFLFENGKVYSLGANGQGQLGIGEDSIISVRAIPTEVINLPTKVKRVYGGHAISIFELENGEYYISGTLGQKKIVTPQKLDLPKNIRDIYIGQVNIVLFTKTDGVYVLNHLWNVVNFETLNVPLETNEKVVYYFGGNGTEFFVTDKGNVYGKGSNNNGQLGDGTTNSDWEFKKISAISNVSTVSMGTHHSGDTFFLTKDGEVYATGENFFGNHADGTTKSKRVPTLNTLIKFNPISHSKFTQTDNTQYMVYLSNEEISKETLKTKINSTQGYFVGSTTASNEPVVNQIIKENANKGNYIDIGTTYDSAALKDYIEKLAMYIIKTQSDNSVEVEFLLDESTGLSKDKIEEKLNTIFKDLIAPDATIILHETQEDGSIIEREEIVPSDIFLQTKVKEISSDYQYSDTVLNGKHRFVVSLKTNDYTNHQKTHLKAANLINNAYFIGVGSSNNEDSIRNIVQTSMHKGTFLELNDLDTVLNEVATYVLATLENNRKIQELFITTDESVNYNAVANDYEMDEIVEEYWKVKHELNYFESETGLISEHNVKLDSPIERFQQTGRYQPIYAVQDDPLTKVFDENQIPLFESYKKWSDEADNWRIYVHKKPSSDFTFTINQLDGDFSVKSIAYDADKASINIGKGKGLQSQSFSWRLEGDYDWNEGIPSSKLEIDKVYEIRNTVVDLQGTKSSTTKLLSRKNLPPVADFETDKPVYNSGESVIITNYSYDPNDDDLTAVWSIKERDQDDTTYREFAKGAASKGVGDVGWNPTYEQILCSDPDSKDPCYYTIKLVVTDIHGASDQTTRDIEVNPQNIEACILVKDAYIGDTVTIINCIENFKNEKLEISYRLTMPENGVTIEFEPGNTSITPEGDLVYTFDQHPRDIGTWHVTQFITQHKQSSEVTSPFQVFDQIISGQVQHTPQWLKNICKFNLAFPTKAFNLGENKCTNGYTSPPNQDSMIPDFFVGERFILQAVDVTPTAEVITVTIEGYEHFNTTLNPGSWDGELWHEDMFYTFKNNEILKFVFKAQFENKWEYTDVVEVRIRHEDYWTQHTSY